jgi:uncharacterized protein YdaU (DUF1376 family)
VNDPRPAFLFHVRDFWTSEAVETMTAAQIGVYLFLLSRQWETGSLPSDATAVLRLCSSIAGVAHADVEVVLMQFPLCADGRRRNARMEFERSIADERSANASNKAKGRWDRWRAQKRGSVDAGAVPQQCRSSATAMQVREGKGREENTIPPYPPSGVNRSDVDPTSTAPKSKPKRAPDGGWQPVLEREDYAGLRSAEPFRLAWQAWIDHTRTAGSKAREPSGHSAAMILNRALREGPERFALAVESSIAGNWQGIHYPEARGFGSPHVSRADRNIAELFEQSRQIGGAS